jgi:hypothetical protein
MEVDHQQHIQMFYQESKPDQVEPVQAIRFNRVLRIMQHGKMQDIIISSLAPVQEIQDHPYLHQPPVLCLPNNLF